jgi:hypothetical protein
MFYKHVLGDFERVSVTGQDVYLLVKVICGGKYVSTTAKIFPLHTVYFPSYFFKY